MNMEQHQTTFTWKIGGEAGFGIMSTGEMFARACMQAGLHVFTYPEYPSIIRGGHNTVQVSASNDPMPAHRTNVALLIALNKETIDLHLAEMIPQGIILFDTSDHTFSGFNSSTVGRSDLHLIGLSLAELTKSSGGPLLMRNTAALGASCALFGFPSDQLADVVHAMFQKKAAGIVTLNTNVLMAGYNAVTAAQRKNFPWKVTPTKHQQRMALMSGNDALALGALQAGCQFYSAYPMTPSSSILHFLAQHGSAYGTIVRHAEDEIAAVHNAIGAAFTGVRAMTATSGGGFSLMTEAVGMAAMTEVGIVIVNAQRGGPSTGLPTWTEQADLRQVLHASQGDFPRIVLAPSSHEECFAFIQHAFNLAEAYQTPVIVLTDKYLAEGLRNVPMEALHQEPMTRGKIWPSEESVTKVTYQRYPLDVPDGIAPRSLPGTPNGLFLANSDEHDEYGLSSEDGVHRIGQMDRRARKIQTLQRHLIPPRTFGTQDASLTVVTWGSSAASVEAALSILQNKYRKSARVVVPTMLAPFPVDAFQSAMQGAAKTVIVEGNQSGQLAGWIRQQTGVMFDHAINRYDGRPFDPEALAKQFSEILT